MISLVPSLYKDACPGIYWGVRQQFANRTFIMALTAAHVLAISAGRPAYVDIYGEAVPLQMLEEEIEQADRARHGRKLAYQGGQAHEWVVYRVDGRLLGLLFRSNEGPVTPPQALRVLHIRFLERAVMSTRRGRRNSLACRHGGLADTISEGRWANAAGMSGPSSSRTESVSVGSPLPSSSSGSHTQ